MNQTIELQTRHLVVAPLTMHTKLVYTDAGEEDEDAASSCDG